MSRAGRLLRFLPLLLAPIASAALAKDEVADDPRPLFFDRIEVHGFGSRQECTSHPMLETTRLEGWGLRLERRLAPGVTVGITGGNTWREGSNESVIPDGGVGSIYYHVDDPDMAYRIGFSYHPDEKIPVPSGSARLGRRDELYVSASFLQSVPAFSTDDLDVGLGFQAAEGLDLWIGATTPLNRDVIGGKLRIAARPFRSLEIGVTGRAGKSTAGRIQGIAVSLAYLVPEPLTESVNRRSRSWFVPRSPGQLEYVGAGVITGAVGGALLSGVISQKACGDTGVRPAMVGLAVGGFLGSFFGRAMWQ